MSDANHAIPSAEATAYPVWFVVSNHRRQPTLWAGPFFSRATAQAHLDAKAHRYPKSAVVYCASGHMSEDYRHLCETGRLREVSNG